MVLTISIMVQFICFAIPFYSSLYGVDFYLLMSCSFKNVWLHPHTTQIIPSSTQMCRYTFKSFKSLLISSSIYNCIQPTQISFRYTQWNTYKLQMYTCIPMMFQISKLPNTNQCYKLAPMHLQHKYIRNALPSKGLYVHLYTYNILNTQTSKHQPMLQMYINAPPTWKYPKGSSNTTIT